MNILDFFNVLLSRCHVTTFDVLISIQYFFYIRDWVKVTDYYSFHIISKIFLIEILSRRIS